MKLYKNPRQYCPKKHHLDLDQFGCETQSASLEFLISLYNDRPGVLNRIKTVWYYIYIIEIYVSLNKLLKFCDELIKKPKTLLAVNYTMKQQVSSEAFEAAICSVLIPLIMDKVLADSENELRELN